MSVIDKNGKDLNFRGNGCPIAYHISVERIEHGIKTGKKIAMFKAKSFKCGLGFMCERTDKGTFKECIIKDNITL